MELPFTELEIRRESRRFYMKCLGCGTAALPTLLSRPCIESVRMFLEGHKDCGSGNQ